MFKLRRTRLEINGAFLDEGSFGRVLGVERLRTTRSGRPFVLMLLEIDSLSPRRTLDAHLVRRTITSLEVCIRQTDMTGWYKKDAIIGVIFTELADGAAAMGLLVDKVKAALRANLEPRHVGRVRISAYPYPSHNGASASGAVEEKLYPSDKRRSWPLLFKRAMDVSGSLALLVLLAPVFLFTALAVKLTSRGPVLFRQTRIGHRGAPFTFLKFRSMYTHSDSGLHKAYVTKFITAGRNGNGNGNGRSLTQGGFYKLQGDPRVTPIGRFLRRTSLDELPQLFNVLRGEMSLVGPRPPVPYEVEQYDGWHQRRVLEAKPGITGLWQVKGRSRTSFDDMVRLDLRYVKEWSIWADVKILIQTPWAVLLCKGAR